MNQLFGGFFLHFCLSLQTYIKSMDKDFVAATIQAIGRCATNIGEVRDTCLNGLVQLLSNRDGKFLFVWYFTYFLSSAYLQGTSGDANHSWKSIDRLVKINTNSDHTYQKP